MAKKHLNLVVITPERQVVSTEATSMSITAHDGEIGILPDRAPLMCELGVGQLRYSGDGRAQHQMLIDGGFMQINRNQVIVLSENAVPADEITDDVVAAAEKAVTPPANQKPETLAAYQRARRRVSILRSLRPRRR